MCSWGLGFRAFRNRGLGFRVWGLGFRGFKVEGLGFKAEGLRGSLKVDRLLSCLQRLGCGEAIVADQH